MPAYTVTKPSWLSSSEELRENGNVVGELTILKKMSYALAEARMQGHVVRFGYKGWNTRNLFIQDALGTDIATAKVLSWWKSDIAVTVDGKNYVWKQKNWWGTMYGWFASDGREVLEFQRRWWAKLDINAPSRPDKTEMTLLLFGMYLLKLEEMAAASGV